MQKQFVLDNVEKLAEVEPSYAPIIERWLKGEILESDAEIMMDIVEAHVDDDMIVWPPAIFIGIENGTISLSAVINKIIARA